MNTNVASSIDIDKNNFDAEVIERSKTTPVVVDFWAPWCGPCRVVGPILALLAAEHAGRLKVIKVNVDENPSLSTRYQAHSIPTLVILKDGKVVDRVIGAMPKPQLAAKLAPHLKQA